MIIFFYYFLAIAASIASNIAIVGVITPTLISLLLAYFFKYYSILESIAGISGTVCAFQIGHTQKKNRIWFILFNVAGYILVSIFCSSQVVKVVMTFVLAWLTYLIKYAICQTEIKGYP